MDKGFEKPKKEETISFSPFSSQMTQDGKLSNQIIEGFEYSIEMVG